MRSVADMLDEWHACVDPIPRGVSPELAKLRGNLIEEEHEETQDELFKFENDEGEMAKLAKELGDLIYVVYGTAHEYGIPLDAVMEAIHYSNMTKLHCNSCKGTGKKESWLGLIPCLACTGSGVEFQKREIDGKVEKGDSYEEPDIQAVLDACKT